MTLKLLAIRTVKLAEILYPDFNASRIASNVDNKIIEQKDPVRPIRTQKPLQLCRENQEFDYYRNSQNV